MFFSCLIPPCLIIQYFNRYNKIVMKHLIEFRFVKKHVFQYVIPAAFYALTFRYTLRWLKNYWFNSRTKIKEDFEFECMELLTFYPRLKECLPCLSSTSSQCNSQECSYSKILRLLDIIGQTKNTLDICIYLFTYQDLYQKLIDLFDSGVKIRIIMDNEMSSTNGSKLKQLLEKGVDVRLRDPQKVMHHKFFIIDNSLLVTGSLNWTRAALVANTEQVLITNKKDFIDKSAGTFKILWDDPNTIQFPVETT